ncbi:MAG: hypothetical protein EAZ42_10820 [Verrucomicrobia bacterium]|nr:MAG: hypothetical protein EAZ42_10820 [Verrucomicrobiota bacterium]
MGQCRVEILSHPFRGPILLIARFILQNIMRYFYLCILFVTSFAHAKNEHADALYSTHCAACHGAELGGGVGGSLIDGIWKHGASNDEITRSIAKGNAQMGMVAWEEKLSAEEIRALVIYIQENEAKAIAQKQQVPVPKGNELTRTQLHDYRLEIFVDKGLVNPWAIAFLSDGRKLVTEKAGQLRIIDANGELDPKPITGIPKVMDHGQGGLMEVAAHPDFSNNGWIYLGFNEGTDSKCITAVVRGKIKDHAWVDQEWIYRPDRKFRSDSGVHFGTRFVFHEGYLYFPIGERSGMMEAQQLDNPKGKMFRLHDDGRIPQDNPFINTPGALAEIWSYGHRNPQGLVMDARDGALYSTEHGPRGGDELNLIQAGKNYGWPVISYGMNYDGTPLVSMTEKEGMEQPLVYWVPSIAVCGLDFYTGDLFPKWQNDLLVGGLASQEVRRVRIENQKVVSQEIILKNVGRVRDVATGPDGKIYVVLNSPDQIVQMVPASE